MNKSVLIPFEKYQYYQNLAKIQATDHSVNEDKPLMKDLSQPNDSTEHRPKETCIKLDPEVVTSHLPKRNRAKALSLLNFIDQHKTLDWNKEGALVVNNEPIAFSHISDLIYDALNPTTKFNPVGCEEFYNNLGRVPVSLISNQRRRSMIGSQHHSPPPPGYSDRPAKPLNNWKYLWKNL